MFYLHIKHDGGQNPAGRMRMSIGPFSRKAATAKLKELFAYHEDWHSTPRDTPPPLCIIKIERGQDV